VEEPIHGGLTYRLAIVAGFFEDHAARLGLATAGVDHNPNTEPFIPSTDSLGLSRAELDRRLAQTYRYHFRSPQEAVADLNRIIEEIARAQPAEGGSQTPLEIATMTRRPLEADPGTHLIQAGVALHLLEDVGTPTLPGPHTPYPDPPGLNCDYQGQGRDPRCEPRGPRFRYRGHPIMHPWGHGGPLHGRDVPINSSRECHALLCEVYRFVVRLRNAYYHGADAATCTPAALAEIERAIALRTKGQALAYLSDRTTAARPLERSYTEWVQYQRNTGSVLPGGPRWSALDVTGYADDAPPPVQSPVVRLPYH
jgi:hypothetical protein